MLVGIVVSVDDVLVLCVPSPGRGPTSDEEEDSPPANAKDESNTAAARAQCASSAVQQFLSLLRDSAQQALDSSEQAPGVGSSLAALVRTNPKVFFPVLFPLMLARTTKSSNSELNSALWMLVQNGAEVCSSDPKSLALVLELASFELLENPPPAGGTTSGGKTSTVGACMVALAKAGQAVFKENLMALDVLQREAVQGGLRAQIAAGG